MKTKHWIAILGILVIGILDTIALLVGIDGVALAAAIGGIGAIIGYTFKEPTKGERGERGPRGRNAS